MSDPRGRVACPKLIDRNNRLQSQRKGFFDALGNLGRVEALNDLGAGDVRKGMSALAAVSNQLKGTKSVVPGQEGELVNGSLYQKITNTAVESVEAGATIVLDATGIGRIALNAVNNINAPVANRALGASKQIFQRVKQGNFSLSDIPEFAQDMGNLANLARNIFPGGDKTSNSGGLSRFQCQPSPYAIDLIQRAPRFKFMYIVDVKFAPAYAEFNGIASGMAFITKSSTRPQVDFEYEEVNMYNYRTHVPKRTIFQPMTMRFIDDQTGTTTRFYELYLKAMSPIASMSPVASGVVGMFEDSSMDFQADNTISFSERLPLSNTGFTSRDLGGPSSQGITEQFSNAVETAKLAAQGIYDTVRNPTQSWNEKKATIAAQRQDQGQNNPTGGSTSVSTKAYGASLGALKGNTKTVLESVTLYHIGNYGDSITSYVMFNPKITSLQPDEVNMADNGDGSELSFEFTYDSLYVEPNQPIGEFGLEALFDKSGGNAGATYPLMPIGTGENTEAGTGQSGVAPGQKRHPGQTGKALPPENSSILPGLEEAFTSPTSRPQAIPIVTDNRYVQDGWDIQTTPSRAGGKRAIVDRGPARKI